MRKILEKYKKHIDYDKRFEVNIQKLRDTHSFPSRIEETSSRLLERIADHSKHKKGFVDYPLKFIPDPHQKGVYSCLSSLGGSNTHHFTSELLIFEFIASGFDFKPLMFNARIGTELPYEEIENIFKYL